MNAELFKAFTSKYFDESGTQTKSIPHDDLVRFLQVLKPSKKASKPRQTVKKNVKNVKKSGDEPLAVTLLKEKNLWKKQHQYLSECYIDAYCGGKVKNPENKRTYKYFATFQECYAEGVRLNQITEGYVGGIVMTLRGFDLRKSPQVKTAKKPDEVSGLCAWSFNGFNCHSQNPEPWVSPFDNEESSSETEESSEEEQEEEEVIPSTPSTPLVESNEEEAPSSAPPPPYNESDTKEECDVYGVYYKGTEFFVAEDYDGNIYELSSDIRGDLTENLHKIILDEYKLNNVVELTDCDADDYNMY